MHNDPPCRYKEQIPTDHVPSDMFICITVFKLFALCDHEKTVAMPIYRVPSTAPAVVVGVRGGSMAQHVNQSTSGQQQRQTGVHQHQVLQSLA